MDQLCGCSRRRWRTIRLERAGSRRWWLGSQRSGLWGAAGYWLGVPMDIRGLCKRHSGLSRLGRGNLDLRRWSSGIERLCDGILGNGGISNYPI
jgi:hypothetical protein